MKIAVTILVFCVAALLALGMVMLYSSSMAQAGAHYLVKQLTGCAVGIVLCVAAVVLDYRQFEEVGVAVVPVGGGAAGAGVCAAHWDRSQRRARAGWATGKPRSSNHPSLPSWRFWLRWRGTASDFSGKCRP